MSKIWSTNLGDSAYKGIDLIICSTMYPDLASAIHGFEALDRHSAIDKMKKEGSQRFESPFFPAFGGIQLQPS